MKKLLAIVLVLALALSMSVFAWAEETDATKKDEKKVVSPEKKNTPVNSDDLPGESDTVGGAYVAPPAEEEAKIIANQDLTDEQKAEVDAAIAKVTEDDVAVADTFYVEAEGDAVVEITLEDGTIVYVIYPDGTVKKLTLAELNALGNDRYEIPVEGNCVIVLAKAA